MSEAGVTRAETIVDSVWLKGFGRIGMALVVPALVFAGAWLQRLSDKVGDLDTRLARMEVTVADKTADIYPRGEAVAQFSQVNGAVDGLQIQLNSATHRLGALEDARNRTLR